MSIVEFDTNLFHSTRAKDEHGNWWRIEGKCLRCGKCCRHDCPYLTTEIVDKKEIYKCTIQFHKPFLCAMHPYEPDIPLNDGCGFKWVRE